MERRPPNAMVFGTEDPPPAVRRLEAGPLTVDFAGGAARRISWRGVEAIRELDCPVRDEFWATLPFEIVDREIRTSADGFEVEHRRIFADGALACRVVYCGRTDGTFTASFEAEAEKDIVTCRAGFVVLHPLSVAGSTLAVTHDDGAIERTEFPRLISPGQVAFDIRKLGYGVEGVEAEIVFDGDVFEMEDQRNWSDASFKTYCRPLARPAPYRLKAGTKVRQHVAVILSGGPPAAPGATRRRALEVEKTGEFLPAVALAIDSDSAPGADEIARIRTLQPPVLQARVRPDDCDAVFRSAVSLAHSDVEFEIEAVLPSDNDIDKSLSAIAGACARHAIPVARVLALPEPYLRNYQPSGPWPEGPSPDDAAAAARKVFPDAEIGVGMLTNFVELNRRRPPGDLGDYASHGSTAIFHAADDRSVVETLDGLRHIFESGRAIAGSRQYRLGLVSIGMRTNTHGEAVAPNPAQRRVPMAGADPRQRGLFAAAWAVGAVAASEGRGVSCLALATPAGPLGFVYRRALWPQPVYDDMAEPAVFPLFHVVRALAAMSRAPRLALRNLPEGVVSVAAEMERGAALIIANVADGAREVSLPERASARLLNLASFGRAIADPDWLDAGAAERCNAFALDPFDIAFVDLPGVRRSAG